VYIFSIKNRIKNLGYKVQDILDRYDKDNTNRVIIKISTKKIEDLYNDFDKESSFSKKDLDEELVEYIIDSVKEIGDEKFVIKFYFKERSEENYERVTNSIKNFFEYLQDLEKSSMKEQITNSFIFMIIGIFFTTISLTLSDESLTQKILSEGLMVAGWVSLWESLATFLIKWLPFSKKLKIYKRVVKAEVEFE
jgi:gas vesicle protein